MPKKSATATKEHYYGTGRRKSCTARVYLYPGKGKITVNQKDIEEFFGRATAKMVVRQPLQLVNMMDDFDIFITVRGGGVMGQAGAIRHGITRALISYDETGTSATTKAKPKKTKKATKTTDKDAEQKEDEEGEGGAESSDLKVTSLRKILRAAGFVTRDPRKVERKKVGRRKARKKEQYSKR